jgi:uncharacterized protein
MKHLLHEVQAGPYRVRGVSVGGIYTSLQVPELRVLLDAGAVRLDLWPFQPAAMLIGAALFGVGIAVLGYCPGTGLAGAAEGSRDAMVGVVGMLAGAGTFVVAYNALEPLALALGDLGKLAVPQALVLSPWAVIAAMELAIALLFWLIELHARNTPDRRSELGSPLPG